VLVTKNPCLHPGDIRKLKAVSVPELESCMRDCIVFSVDGSRPNCNEMAGSDLDGDQYWVYWGDEFKIDDEFDPLSYPPAKKSLVDRVTNELIVDHALDTFTDSTPGMIANTHKAIADKFPSGTHSTECKECAMLFA
jgi:RNA-dependent RNA polymerase